MIEALIGICFVVAIVGSYAWNKKDRDRYYQLEHKRRFGGKRLSQEDQVEWERLARKFKW